MEMGLLPDARATLRAVIDAAAPEPVPADQAIALLQGITDLDSEALGRLAYHALTGVDPGDAEPTAPIEVLPGFPPFAAEVLMRAICGPDHRRPTPQAVSIVLDTVPAASWPTAGRPHVVADVPAAATPAEVAPETVETPVAVETPVVEVLPEVVSEPEPEVEDQAEPEVEAPAPVTEAIDPDAEFRNLLIPSRAVPRFDPLSDPWEPEPALQSEQAFEENGAHDAEEQVADVEPEPVAGSDPEPDPEPDVEADVELEPEPAPLFADEVEPVAALADMSDTSEPEGGMFSEFRNIVPTSFEVPKVATSRDDGLGALAEDPRGHTSGRRRSSSGSSSRVGPTEPKDRGPMLLLVAAIVVLILLAVVYFAAKSLREDSTDITPQGASRTTSQPVDARA